MQKNHPRSTLNLPGLLRSQIVLKYFLHDNTACGHSCSGYTKSKEPSVCHILWSILRLLVPVCSQTTECPVYRCETNKHFTTICEQTFDNSLADVISSSLKLRSSRQAEETLYNCFVVLFANSFHAFLCVPSFSFDHVTVFTRGFSLGTFSVAPEEIRDSNKFLKCSTMSSLMLHSR